MAPGSIGAKAKETGRIVWTPISQPIPKAKAKLLSLSLGLGRPLLMKRVNQDLKTSLLLGNLDLFCQERIRM